ncbi:hypothetical protein [Limnoglobus roseus]|uniref:Uncharacterized protein n=1 Tax=Limnoglobus roseus TaxID=2598579 RepID=A0A5C1AK72_9BACT|nr:hypothetical protein [Limnoglobus roseus]QEL18603.1 hypothetical protein PX52LOC_05635 [Limnoglobus roseus]
MAKKKAVDSSAEATAQEAEATTGKLTQREAVEKALAAGMDTPAEGVPYVKGQFNITLSNQAFSTIKSKIKNGGKPAKRTPRAATAPAAARSTAVSAPAGGLSLHIDAIKTLVETLGVNEVVSIARLFAK